MGLAEFRKVLEKIEPWAFEVVLHNWGEPFLHPHLLEIVRATKRAGIGAAVSSNLNLVGKGSEFLREIVDSGLDHLVVSIDGTTQAVYQEYRRGGCLDHVMANLKELVAIKRESGSRTPIIEWQFLMMKHNEHQADEARRIADELGVGNIRFTGAGLPFDDLADAELAEKWLPTDPKYRDAYDPARIRERGYLYDQRCFYLYRAMTVNPRGEVAPCCAIHHQAWDFGNLLDSNLEELWNNPHYRASRALFSRRPHESQLQTACHQCPLFRHEHRPDGSGRSCSA
jgi:radical SAM protein with 4Fe4S-binding SPASM domain